MSFFRRAGALIARFFESAADPAAVANEFKLYAKDAAGVTQLYGRSDDGVVHKITGVVNDGFTTIVATADEDATNVFPQDHTQLKFAVTAGKIYAVELFLISSGNDTAGDYRYRFGVNAGTMDGRGVVLQLNASDAIASTALAAVVAATTGNIGIGVAADLGFPYASTCAFSFRQNTSSGTFVFQFGNNVTGVGRISRTLAGTVLRYKQLN